MSHGIPVRGIELRYLLTTYLFDHGPSTVDELIDGLALQGFDVVGRPSKAVSDALRWEMRHHRVARSERGVYRPGVLPRSTEYRIDQRVLALRARAAAIPREAA
ncbi:hypothetical protein [Mycolicibacterium tokaiense]|jgi:hypothetical protein|uniref:Uncharacterized protein n=1 Tax=Mycolicibacterium tokaiense TaxID=39695 RepID=A0A378TN37_9MYCO|nr:hypothetical protein [Mycolicibacterium tokaiense]BBY89417.1 hypothetical protein MTOK_51990 [Mycolicibacterium tokaiense]STZ62198.1 Uncharacterised protein [Mycolicibacterium tokaiense]